MADNKTAHIFLTGCSIKKFNDFSIISESDFVITTNLGVLHEYIASRINAYFISTNSHIKYKKITELCLQIADTNTNNSCIFYVKKGHKKNMKNMCPNRAYQIIDSDLPLISNFSERMKIKSNTVFRLFSIVNTLGYNEVYLWGADYILKEPIHRHFYEFTHVQKKQPDEFSLALYRQIKRDFNSMTIKHVCPENSKSYLFESIYVE